MSIASRHHNLVAGCFLSRRGVIHHAPCQAICLQGVMNHAPTGQWMIGFDWGDPGGSPSCLKGEKNLGRSFGYAAGNGTGAARAPGGTSPSEPSFQTSSPRPAVYGTGFSGNGDFHAWPCHLGGVYLFYQYGSHGGGSRYSSMGGSTKLHPDSARWRIF